MHKLHIKSQFQIYAINFKTFLDIYFHHYAKRNGHNIFDSNENCSAYLTHQQSSNGGSFYSTHARTHIVQSAHSNRHCEEMLACYDHDFQNCGPRPNMDCGSFPPTPATSTGFILCIGLLCFLAICYTPQFYYPVIKVKCVTGLILFSTFINMFAAPVNREYVSPTPLFAN